MRPWAIVLVVYLLALYVIGRTSHLSVLFVCCLFLIRAPVPAYEGSYREGESQVHFGVRTQGTEGVLP